MPIAQMSSITDTERRFAIRFNKVMNYLGKDMYEIYVDGNKILKYGDILDQECSLLQDLMWNIADRGFLYHYQLIYGAGERGVLAKLQQEYGQAKDEFFHNVRLWSIGYTYTKKWPLTLSDCSNNNSYH